MVIMYITYKSRYVQNVFETVSLAQISHATVKRGIHEHAPPSLRLNILFYVCDIMCLWHRANCGLVSSDSLKNTPTAKFVKQTYEACFMIARYNYSDSIGLPYRAITNVL